MIAHYVISLERKTLFILLLILLLHFIPCLISPGQAQSICERNLNEAEHLYNVGNFEGAIGLLTECLETEGVTKEERLQAYRLLGLNYIAKDYLDLARSAVRKLIEMVPNYQADPVQDPPPFTKLIEEVKLEKPEKEEGELKKTAEVQSFDDQKDIVEKPQAEVSEADIPEPVESIKPEEKSKSKKWFYIGGGAVLAGGAAVVYFLTRNGKTVTQSFPSPPGRP